MGRSTKVMSFIHFLKYSVSSIFVIIISPIYITEDIFKIYHRSYMRECDGDHNFTFIILINL
jgi:hypothetical protein